MKKVNYQIDVETVRAQKNVKNLNKEIKTTNKEVKDTGQSMQGITSIADKATGGAISGFKNLKGSISGVTAGFKTMKLALISTGIGALVVLLGSLVAAFSSTEGGQDKFTKLTGAIGVVVNNLVDVLATLGEKLISAFEKPKESWENFIEALDNGYEFVKKQFIDRLTSSWTIMSGGIQKGLLKMRIAWLDFTNEAEKADKFRDELKLIQEDMNEASETLAERNKEIANAIKETYDDAKKASKEFLEEQQKEIAIQNKISDDRAKANKIERDLVTERAEADRKIAELRDIAAQKDRFNLKQRKRALIEASEINERIASHEIEVAKIRRDAIIEENKLSKSNKEDLDKAADASARVIRLETTKLNLQKRLNTELATINAQAAAEEEAARKEKEANELALQKTQAEALKKQLLKEEQQYNLLQELQNTAQEQEIFKLTQQYDKKFELAQGNAELEKALTEQQALDVEAINKKYRDLKEAANNETNKTILANDEATTQARLSLEQALVESTSSALNSIATLAGEGTKVAKTAALADILISTGVGFAKGLEIAQKSAAGTGPAAAFAFPIFYATQIAAVLGAAAQAKTILTKVKGPNGNVSPSPPTGGGGGIPSQAPSFNVVGASGFNQIAGALGQQGPVQAFVVGSQVTTQQQLDNNIVATATL